MKKKYIVRLTEEERNTWHALVSKGKAAAYKIKHANILLNADVNGPQGSDSRIAQALGTSPHTVRTVRQRFVEQGVQAALGRKKRAQPPKQKLLDGRKEAQLVALRCSEPPTGRVKWTLGLLADTLVELQVVDTISHETVRQTVKKTN